MNLTRRVEKLEAVINKKYCIECHELIGVFCKHQARFGTLNERYVAYMNSHDIPYENKEVQRQLKRIANEF